MPRPPLSRSKVLLLAAAVALGAAVPAFGSAAKPAPTPFTGAGAGYSSAHFGDGNMPAGCIVDRDEANPDNGCHHLKVGLNNLDSPIVNVAVLVPVSPTAERDMRVMRQAVEMWGGGIDHLAKQMNMDWLAEGVQFNVTTKLVPVDANGLPTQAVNLVKPKIVVIATNPAGGIGIGINPTDFLGEVGFTDGQGVPCGSIPDPFNMASWEKRPGFDGHHKELGGIYVERCDGAGGQVCFSVNGAVDPLPGKTDFFSLYDLVAHETGHCLTLGHVGDGAEGPWGVIPTADIMAYSSDPVDVAKCVSTLDVEGFAIQMSNYLDTNGDGKVDGKDVLVPNDAKGDGMNSFQVQNPKDHWYASPTGRAEDCPQPDWGVLPVAEETDWQPRGVATTTPKLSVGATSAAGRVNWKGTASWVTKEAAPRASSGTITDPTLDGTLPTTDITGLTASVTRDAVKATVSVDQLWPTTDGGRVTGYGLYVGGRKFDSFVTTQGTSSEVQTIDSGGRHIMPAGTSSWDTEKGTVSFTIPRGYLAKHRIQAPYGIFAATGVHIRTKDWVTSLD
ncbi:MAG: Thrombospondin type 3 repeat, partial [Frankiales bacterium]|nr:Thrombospondin type 3 repeat [Frankiales bacterium]